jgi:hypothetical protein
MLALGAWRSYRGATASPAQSGPGYSIPRHIEYGFTVHNETNRVVAGAELWIQAPVKETPTQRCGRLAASHPHDLTEDDSGNQTLHFVFRDLPPYATKIIRIQTDLMLSDAPHASPAQHPDRYLAPERFIESDDPAIIRLARTLRASTPTATAENIFRWVAEKVRYTGYLPDDRGALHALKNRWGDCSELAYLFAACCRASSIPARVLAGYVCGSDSLLKPTGYHNWAEFYVNGTWHVADPQRKVFMESPSQYVAMHVSGEGPGEIAGGGEPSKMLEGARRFRCEGDGIKVAMIQ